MTEQLFEVGAIERTDNKKTDMDSAIAIIEESEKAERHWGCSWTLQPDGRIIHNCKIGSETRSTSSAGFIDEIDAAIRRVYARR